MFHTPSKETSRILSLGFQRGLRRRWPFRLSFWVFLVVLIRYFGDCPNQTFAQQSGPSLKRWAIICSPNLKALGVSDLLTAQLSEVADIDLVERDQIDKVSAELALTNFSDPSNIKNRLAIGQQINADFLAIISTEKLTNVEVLRVVVCECQLGTRIFDTKTNLAIESDSGGNQAADVESIVKTCQSQILRTRRRFAEGIKRIIGVPPFQSKNLTHRWDRYQSGFQNLLKSALLAYPGIAVVEIEEARAVQRELARKSDLSLKQSAVVMVSGSFEFASPISSAEYSAEEPPTVKFEISADQLGDKLKDSLVSGSRKPMSLDEAQVFLTKTLPKKLVVENAVVMEDPLGFSQLRWLEEQSNQFFHRGQWQLSATLCEAAILLDPKNIEVRRRAIRCYLNICSTISFDGYTVRDSPLDDARLVTDVHRREEAYLTYLSHLEYLIRNRLVSANEATNWIRTTQGAFIASGGGNSSLSLIRRYKEIATGLESAEQSFIRRVKPLVLSLDWDPSYQIKGGGYPSLPKIKNETDLVLVWDYILFRSVTDNMNRQYRSPADLDRVYEIISKEIPEGRPLLQDYHYFFGRHRENYSNPTHVHMQNADCAKNQDWENLVNRLANCGNETARIIARSAEINQKYYRYLKLKRESNKSSEKLVGNLQAELEDEIEKLCSDYYRLPYSTEYKEHNRSKETIPRQLRMILRKYIRGRPAKDAAAVESSQQLPPGIAQIDYSDAAGVVREIPLKFKTRSIRGKISDRVDLYTPSRPSRERKRTSLIPKVDSAEEAPKLFIDQRPLQLTRCGDVDVWMTPAQIMIMRRKGLLEIVFSDRQAFLLDVLWDGKYAWVSTLYDGIKILDLKTGTLSPSINESHGLPPANADLKMIDIAPGKILAVGSFGKTFRAWCATITLKNKRPIVDVFHKATDPTGNPEGEPDWQNTNLTFLPGWICRFDPGNGEPKNFLVGRRRDGYYREHRPLVVDIDKRKVSTDLYHYGLSSNRSGGFVSNQNTFFSLDGKVFRIRQGQIRLCKPYFEQKLTETMKKDRGLELCNTSKGIKISRSGRRTLPRIYYHVLQDGQIITAGMQWYKLDPKSLKEKRYVSPDPQQVLKSPEDWGFSAHYGLIGWDDDDETSFRQYVLEDVPNDAQDKDQAGKNDR